MAYDPNKTYIFTNDKGESFTSKGDNGYVWQAMENGLPLSTNEKGEWFVTPYIDRNSDGTITAYIPDWFKETDAYTTWNDAISSYSKDYIQSMTQDNIINLNTYLKSLGNQGIIQKLETNYAKSFGLNDELSAQHVRNYINAITEMNGGDTAAITFSDGTTKSVADIVNEYGNISKEDLSAKVVEFQKLLNQAKTNMDTYGSYFPRTNLVTKIQENPDVIQKKVSDALLTYQILQTVKDKGSLYQDGKYKDILSSSEHQQFMTGLASYASAAANNPLANLIMSGVNWVYGIDENPQDYLSNRIANGSDMGAGLEGREGAISVGGIMGTVANLAITAAEIYLTAGAAGSLGAKWALSGGKVASTIGGFLSGASTFAMSPAGMLTADFLINDLPQDIAYFIMRGTQTGDWKGALLSEWSKEEKPTIQTYDKNGNPVTPEKEVETQKLVPLFVYPVVDENGIASLGAGIGPEVPSGLLTDIAGDIIADLSMPIVNTALGVVSTKLDAATGGALSRIKEDIAIKNLQLQEKLTEIPVVGTAWKKTVDAFMGAQNANLVRESRKTAIAEHSLDPYITMHNLITIKNHGGSEMVAKMYTMLDQKWGVSKKAAEFAKAKSKYGGEIGKVKVTYSTAVAGEKKVYTKIVDDVLPVQVKKGVMDIERLYELKGLEAKEEGVVQDSARLKEIATLEKRVSKLPQDIKDFADKLSGLNKDVEKMGVILGVKDKDWAEHLMSDPQFEKYMTRQALLPFQRTSEYVDSQKQSAQWNRSRTGDYSSKYVDPIISLNMKVAALGRTVTDNQIAKSLVGFQNSRGNVIRGAGNIEYGKKIAENNAKIASAEGLRSKIKYDEETSGISNDMKNIGKSLVSVWDAMILPQDINLKAVYQPGTNSHIKSHVQDFENGKISFAEGVREEAGLSDLEANTLIKNTYRANNNTLRDVDGKNPKVVSGKKPEPEMTVHTGDRTVEVTDLTSFLKYGDIDFNNFGHSVNSFFFSIADKLGLKSKTKAEAHELFVANVSERIGLIDAQRKEGLITFKEAGTLTRKEIERALRNVFTDDDFAKVFGGKIEPTQPVKPPVKPPVEPTQPTQPTQPVQPTSPDQPIDLPRVSQQIQDLTRQAERTIQDNLEGGYYFDSDTESLVKRGLLTREDDNGEIYYYVKDNPTLDELEEIYNWQKKMTEDWDRDDFTEVNFEEIRSLNPNQPNLLGFTSEDKSNPKIDLDRVVVQPKPEENYGTLPEYAGVTADGIPYSYQVIDNKIVNVQKIETPEALADSVRSLGYNIDTTTVTRMGEENTYALNRSAIFYRDNTPTLPVKSSFALTMPKNRNSMGFINGFTHYSYNWKVNKDGLFEGTFTAHMGETYYSKDKQKKIKAALASSQKDWDAGKIGFHPRNSQGLENVPIHETGHSYMIRLTMLDLNRRISEGDADAIRIRDMYKNSSSLSIGAFFEKEWEEFQSTLAKRAMDKLGVEYNKANWMKVWRDLSGVNPKTAISEYAAKQTSTQRHAFMYETFAEAFTDYAFNGSKASPWTLALMEEVISEAKKYGMASSPEDVMRGNGLQTKNLFNKDGDYRFPKGVTTRKQQAEWLNKQRQANPYIKESGMFTPDTYQKANLWDTYFRSEILAYDSAVKTSMPDKLVTKNGDFQESIRNNTAEHVMNEIKKYSVKGFDMDLATMIISKHGEDVSDAIESFITRRIDESAKAMSSRMNGGESELNQARISLYSDHMIKTDTIEMVKALVPDMDAKAATDLVNNLFDKQAKGLAAYEALPVNSKALANETAALKEKLYKENQKVLKFGKEMDAKIRGEYEDATHVISYREGGADVVVVVKDPVVASILKRPNDYKQTGLVAESFVHMGNFLSRTYRLGTTGINPVALVRNVIRDPVQAALTSGFNPLSINLSPTAFYKTLRQFGLDEATINTVTTKLKDWASSQTLTQQLRGENINANTIQNAGYRNTFEKKVKQLDKVTNNKIVNAAEKPLEMWETMLRTQIAQQSFTKAYRQTGDVNRAMSRAMFDSSNATTNFSHSIGKFQRAASTVPYLTSAINGTTSFWRLFNIDPVGMTARITAGFMVPVMAITAWNLSSEERRKAYMNLPEWWRDGHLILMDEDGNKIFALTIPEEVSAYYGTVRRLIEYTNDASPSSLATILAQGALGMLPGDTDGFVDDYGNWNIGRGVTQYVSGLVPQAVNLAYELYFEENLYTGQDLSNYTTWNKVINALTNVFGTGFKNIINDIGYLCGTSEDMLLGKTTADTLARDLFGIGFDNATSQFLTLIGKQSKIDENGKETKATGLFAENEKLQAQIATLTKNYAFATEEEQKEIDEKKQKLIDDYVKRVSTMVNKYMQLYSATGGLTHAQKNQIVSLLNLANGATSASGDSAEALAQEEANSGEYNLAVQRYVDAGLPAGATIESLAKNRNGNTVNSLEVKAALNRYYGESKQATADLTNALSDSNLKDVKDKFYDAINKIYDIAERDGTTPDYDMIEKIQARYLQSVDAVLVPIIQKYGVNILSNNSFINEVRSYVNGMIPSDDWRQSTKNAKKYLSTKEFPTATVDVKKWLQQRYTSELKDRNIASDEIVTETLSAIREDIDNGRYGAASSKIDTLVTGMKKSSFYISSNDLQTLYQYKSMLK